MTDEMDSKRKEELKALEGIVEDENGRLRAKIPVYYL